MNKNCFFLIIVTFAIVFLSSTCQREEESNVQRIFDDQGVAIATPFLWKTSLHQKEPTSNSYIKNQIIYNNNIVVPTTNGEESRALSLLNTIDGKILWSWDDIYKDHLEYIDVDYHHQYENLFTFQIGGRGYCINLENGTTKWHHRRDRSFDVRMNSIDNLYFVIYGPIDNNSEKYHKDITSFIGDIKTGIISEFLTPNFTYENPDYWRGVQFINQIPNKDNLLLVSYFENLEDYVIQPFFGLYDKDLDEWIWDRILITPPKHSNVIDWPPIIENNKIYAVVDNCVVCHDLETGTQIWKREFYGNFLFSGFLLEEGKVIANCEDTYAYALDAENGNILWSVKTAGTSSRMSYLNGVVYMVGGSGGGRLFAIEASTGKMLWRIDAGLLGEGEGARFRTNAVYVLPAKDDQPAKVIALSDMYAYCFEAER
ncbi:MAG: PQQ-binding-like beta-propeller repeat protein [Marinilabiliaceae bacterium]|nr:PQQ-binding-like beta-propeller repeat protein [Marinilabiliaceae bacterium]